MPLTLETLMARATPSFLDVFAETVTYRAENDSDNDKEIEATVEREQLEVVSEQGDEYPYQTMPVWISSRNDTEGQQTVNVWHEDGTGAGDAIIIGSTTWYVRKRLGDAVGGMHHLLLSDSLLPMIPDVE